MSSSLQTSHNRRSLLLASCAALGTLALLTGCASDAARATGPSRTAPPVVSCLQPTHHNQPLQEWFSQPDQSSAQIGSRDIVRRQRSAKETDVQLSLAALQTITLSATGQLTEPLSASADIVAERGTLMPCDTKTDPPPSEYQAIVSSGGPGTTGFGSSNTRVFRADIEGLLSSADDDVTMMGFGKRPRIKTKRAKYTAPGSMISVWNNAITAGTTIPGLPQGATDVRIDAVIFMSGFGELRANSTETLCVKFIDSAGSPTERFIDQNELGLGQTLITLEVSSELGYIVAVTYSVNGPQRYLQWSGNINLGANGQPTVTIGPYESANPVKEDGRSLALEMQRRAAMMLIRYP